MVIFKKNKEEKIELNVEQKQISEKKDDSTITVDINKKDEVEQKQISEKKDIPKEIIVTEKADVPLFVKLNKYRNIIETLNDIKAVLFFARNTLNVQRQIEILLEDNKRLLGEAIDKLNDKIFTLESELKPGQQETKISHEKSDSLENAIDDLKKQIETLKLDLKNIS